MRALARGALGVATALTLLAGCLGTPSDDEPPAAQPGDAAPPPVTYEGTCSAAILFQFVDYAQTDQYLPPGFHPRDPQDFLTFLPVAVGQAGILLLFAECEAVPEQALSFASVGIFVEPPFVDGYPPGLYDFYEVDRMGTADPFRPALRLAAWPEHDAEVALTLAEASVDRAITVATAQDAEGVVVRFDAATTGNGGEVSFGEGAVRFWHDGPAGLGVFEIDAALLADIGAGTCTARSGTVLAAFVGGTDCLAAVGSEPVAATLPSFTIASSARLLPGVHAE